MYAVYRICVYVCVCVCVRVRSRCHRMCMSLLMASRTGGSQDFISKGTEDRCVDATVMLASVSKAQGRVIVVQRGETASSSLIYLHIPRTPP